MATLAIVRRIVLLVLCVGSLTATGGVVAQAETAQRTSFFNERWLKTVVSIEVRAPDAENKESQSTPIGTGFLVADSGDWTALVTNAHVVKDEAGRLRPGLIYIRTDINSPDGIVAEDTLVNWGFGPWFFSTTHDLAIRSFGRVSSAPPFPVIPRTAFLTDQTTLNIGADLLVLGFPLGLRRKQPNLPRAYEAVIARKATVASRGEEYVLLDTFVFPGNSGGPAVYVPVIKVGAQSLTSPIINEERLVGVIRVSSGEEEQTSDCPS